MLEEDKQLVRLRKVNITRQTVYRIKMIRVILVNGLSMQMSVSHSVPKYMLIVYYEILIIRQE